MKPTTMTSNERGATLALVAVTMVVLLGMAALAVDLSMGYATRAEAQRIADAAALAGGSAFMDFPQAQAFQPAQDRAYEYALGQGMRGEPVDSSEITVQIDVAERLVRVGIRRQGVPTWFARVIGFDDIDIAAKAAAKAMLAGTARCLKPIALPDMWHDADDDDNGNNVWDPGEEWIMGSHPDDRYQRFNGMGAPDAATATGYGSDHRGPDRDYGRSIQIKGADPNDEYNLNPGLFYPWRLPTDEDMADCDKGGGGLDAGGSVYRNNICECNDSPVQLDTPYELEPGNMIGPTYQGIDELMSEDPDAYWDPAANEGRGGIVNSAFGPGMASPRVIKIALFDISQVTAPGMQTIEFNNFALMFLEGQQSPQSPVNARFLYYASGDGSGPDTGSLVLYLRLVE
ncbi:MAG: pilus assembly protein TadG-related protein [Gemmatimonadota bacterium]